MWADKTSEDLIQGFLEQFEQDKKSERSSLWIGVASLTILVIVTGIQAISVGHFFLGIAIYAMMGLILHWIIKRQKSALEYFDIGGYALSNHRLFELDKSLTLSQTYDARKLRHVYEGAGGIVLKPIEAGWLKRYKLYFLETDVYVTINALDAVIKRARS